VATGGLAAAVTLPVETFSAAGSALIPVAEAAAIGGAATTVVAAPIAIVTGGIAIGQHIAAAN
jgi:hypothetical protein